MTMLVRLVLGLLVLKAVVAGPRFSRQVDEDVDQDTYEYEDELTIGDPQIEIGTLAPPDFNYPVTDALYEEQEEEEEELPLTPRLISQGSGGSGDLMGPNTQKEEGLLPATPEPPQEGAGGVEESGSSGEPEEPEEPVIDWKGMPTCLLCTCLGGSVYCDDLKLDSVPPLPKDTTHFYARYNRITKINKSDFAFMNKLKRIDLTANEIKSIDERAFLGLPELEELVIRENHVSRLPALPETMSLIDASHNDIGSKGVHQEAFKDMTGLLYLYLTDNHIDYIPVPLPDSLRSLHLQRNNIQTMHGDTFCNLKDFNYIRNALEDIRLDGNPINLSRTPQAYVCLPRIPIGDLF
ncbi:epiphycan [Pungitius pungitius]|uniref:epiphycan n=1 Tax=Pungitius pungitius TaxID=134920 RepID=UPI001888E3B1|nr:epiphycan [Pungitius pungitius]